MASICGQCDKPEEKCDCDRYCILCHSMDNVRLVNDGQYYCVICRECCDYHVES